MKLDRTRLIFGMFVLAFIVVLAIVCSRFHWPTWPAFIVWILFFLEQMNAKKAPHILVGSVSGIGLFLIAPFIVGPLTPMLGHDLAILAFILLAVFAIIVFGEAIPLILNNYAFLFLTVAGLALGLPDPNPYLWMALAAIGGGALIGATLLTVMFLTRILSPAAVASAPDGRA